MFSKKDSDTNTLVPNTDFIAKCEKTLTIFNNAIPTIMPLLKQLNLVGTERYINLEYVEKRGNVIIYESEFLVLHNIKEFGYGLTDKTKKPTRIKKDADYNKQALAKLAEALKPFAAKYDFSVLVFTYFKSYLRFGSCKSRYFGDFFHFLQYSE